MVRTLGASLPWYYAVVSTSIVTRTVTADDEDYSCHELDPTSTYTCPTFRYCPWTSLPYDYQKTFSKKLGYTMLEWDYVLVNEIERSSYANLANSARKNLEKAGYTQATHDCCQNHYQDFTWALLASDHPNVLAALRTLGYDKESWNAEDRTQRWSPSSGYVWENMPEEIRYALRDLCHTKETWSGFSLTTWPQGEGVILPGQIFPDPTPAPTTSPAPSNLPSFGPSPYPTPLRSNTPSNPPSVFHSAAPTLFHSANPTDAPTVFHSANPTDAPTVFHSANPTDVPSDVPSYVPSATPSVSFLPTLSHSPSLSSFPSKSPTSTPTSMPTSLPSSSPSSSPSTKPSSSPTSSPSTSPTLSFLPSVSFLPTMSHSPSLSSFPSTSPTTTPTSTPTLLPSSSPSSSPTVNPSSSPSFSPSTSPTSSPSVSPTESVEPSLSPTESFSPTDLPSYIPSQRPSIYTKPPAVALVPPAGCRELEPEFDYWCPVERYCLWQTYPAALTNMLFFDVGYAQTGWDYVDVPSPVDGSYWAALPHAARQALRGFGYFEDRHDCCNNHYWEYTWEEMTSYDYLENVTRAFELLGYNEKKWGAGAITEYMDYWFEELPWEIQLALYDDLCYTPELWNEVPLALWPRNATMPGSWNVTEYGEYVEPTYDDDDEASALDDLFSNAGGFDYYY